MRKVPADSPGEWAADRRDMASRSRRFARWRTSRPAVVGFTPLEERSSSATPSSVSKDEICRVTAGCERNRRWAARLTEPSSQAATKASRAPKSSMAGKLIREDVLQLWWRIRENGMAQQKALARRLPNEGFVHDLNEARSLASDSYCCESWAARKMSPSVVRFSSGRLPETYARQSPAVSMADKVSLRLSASCSTTVTLRVCPLRNASEGTRNGSSVSLDRGTKPSIPSSNSRTTPR